MKPKKKPAKKLATPTPAPANTPARWDVVIYEIATRKVNAVVGTDMPEEGSHHTVDKRMETAMGRINAAFSVAKVPPGKYKLHSVLEEGDLNL